MKYVAYLCTIWIVTRGQIGAWQSLHRIGCKSAQPMSSWVEEPVSPVRQSSSGDGTLLLMRIPPQAEDSTNINVSCAKVGYV